MKYKESLQKVLDYIEENLYEDLNLDNMSSIAGYSKYHFLRVFKEELYMTPAEYVRKRRITESARDIVDTGKSLSEIGLMHGFNSKENFTRAFKSEHRILPSDYRIVDNSLKLLHKQDIEDDHFAVVPKIIELKPFSATVYKSDETDHTKFWNRYNSGGFSSKLSGGEAQLDYGFSEWNFKEHKLDYYIGILTELAHGDLSGTVHSDVEGGLYAVFDTPKVDKHRFVNYIHKTWAYIYDEWLPQSEYINGGGLDFETYKEDSREFSERIFIRIKRK